MKAHLSNLLFGTNNLLSGSIALAFILTVALGCTCGKNLDLANLGKNSNSVASSEKSANTSADADDEEADGDMPGDELLNALVRETTADFAYAISTEDFSQMYDKAS